ncbi:glutathione S-transferase [Martelella alba]|uniref:Glutathione S-transferase n=1 Tax=Martelella alba TaxID=2590451 RepID=A0A506U8K4_9HYPH|nr:glutathione S-transferase [Martelella alba]TPW29828.1 glutathione S-transferase [Martelella alba]
MKLYCSPASPYSAKVRMAARYLALPIEEVHVATPENPAELLAVNPLGKIPTLVSEDGESFFDSRVIMHYMDSLSEDAHIYPHSAEKRARVERMEALCDGITDAALLVVYETRFRSPETWHGPWVERQWEKVRRGLDVLEADPPKIGNKLNAGHFALASLLAYLMIRFPGQWEEARVRLTEWPAAFQERFPAFADTRPKV